MFVVYSHATVNTETISTRVTQQEVHVADPSLDVVAPNTTIPSAPPRDDDDRPFRANYTTLSTDYLTHSKALSLRIDISIP